MIKTRVAWAVALATAGLALGPSAFAQAPAAANAHATLAVGGDVPHPLSLTPADIKVMPRTSVTVSEEGREVKYEGVLLASC